MEGTIDITQEQALEYAKTYLGGLWTKLQPDQVNISIKR